MWWWCIAIGVLTIVVVQNRRLSNKRTRALAVLNRRADVDLAQEWHRLAAAHSIDTDDVRRIWFAMAKEYGIPAEKLRVEDRFDGELAGLFGHPDYDPFLASLFLGNRAAVEKHLVGTTWGEVVVSIRNIESQVGRLATVPSKSEHEHVWAT